MSLKCDLFRGDPRLEKAAQNSPTMKIGERGEPVAKLQRGLIKLRFALPKSTSDGPPDGMFGEETRNAVSDFQRTRNLSADGIVGRQTLTRLDEEIHAKMYQPVRHFVHGARPMKQPDDGSCWATAYTIMANWKRNQNLDIPAALGRLGRAEHWLSYFHLQSGLPVWESDPFGRDAALCRRGLQCYEAGHWESMLKKHGLLWIIHGWQVFGLNGKPKSQGRHAVVVSGISGDGSPQNTTVYYLEPSWGLEGARTLDKFNANFNLGIDFQGQDPLENWEVANFSQILHY